MVYCLIVCLVFCVCCVCWFLVGVRVVLFEGCCVSLVIFRYGVLRVVWFMLFVVCPYVVCFCLLFVVCHLWFVGSWLPVVVSGLLCIGPCVFSFFVHVFGVLFVCCVICFQTNLLFFCWLVVVACRLLFVVCCCVSCNLLYVVCCVWVC